jgi:uncharacterized membrane protein YfcA
VDDLAIIIPAAAALLGFFSAFLGAAAGAAAGFVLTLVFGTALGTTAEKVLEFAPNDAVSTALLLVIYGSAAVAGYAAKSAYDNA